MKSGDLDSPTTAMPKITSYVLYCYMYLSMFKRKSSSSSSSFLSEASPELGRTSAIVMCVRRALCHFFLLFELKVSLDSLSALWI